MIGGGNGAFIGAVHRIAANIDGQIELVAGAFSANPENAKESGRSLYLSEDRIYTDWENMLEIESTLPETNRVDLISIVTPNFLHFPQAKRALELGFHVICDKPLTINLEQAIALQAVAEAHPKQIFALTHTYSGYPMVKQAKAMVEHNELGKIRKVVVEYSQGWLATKLEAENQKQALWRSDPKLAGKGGCIGDIGTHAAHLAEYMTGLKITRVCAQMNNIVAGRQLDDDINILLEFDNGAVGVLIASQISTGEENNLKIKVYGETSSLEWQQMEPNTLIQKNLVGALRVLRTGVAPFYEITKLHTRVPSGHPEGYLEAFANIYRNVAYHIQGRKEVVDTNYYDYPTLSEGIRGMNFIEKSIQSNLETNWVDL